MYNNIDVAIAVINTKPIMSSWLFCAFSLGRYFEINGISNNDSKGIKNKVVQCKYVETYPPVREPNINDKE